MTYCLGIMLPEGLVLASDSRSNAGVDHLTTVRKLTVFQNDGERMICILSAGNLATTQTIIATLKEEIGSGTIGRDLFAARSMFRVAQTVGDMMREIVGRDGPFVQPYGDPNCSLIVGGQINGDRHRLFEIYSAGNFVEASSRTPFVQTGELKYGKPILDRGLDEEMSLVEAGKLALLSFDATIRSNLSVQAPIDMLLYRAGSFDGSSIRKFNRDDDYWHDIRRQYGDGLMDLVRSLPPLPDSGSAT
jgi:putative proteasome-type protease